MFQTVAECVLFYYLTKKNENYKNIVRRNYRRRGRSQVCSPFKSNSSKRYSTSHNKLCRAENQRGMTTFFFNVSPLAIARQPGSQLQSFSKLITFARCSISVITPQAWCRPLLSNKFGRNNHYELFPYLSCVQWTHLMKDLPLILSSWTIETFFQREIEYVLTLGISKS